MASEDRLLGMYLHLARASQLRKQPMVRAKLLVLAGVQADAMGLDEIAALCRHKVLAQNGRHLVRRWPTISAALDAEGFQTYLKQLQRRYSNEKVEHMVQSLGIVMGRERAAYFSDTEYAAALLDTKVESIAGVIAAEPAKVNGHKRSPEDKPAPTVDALPAPAPRALVVWAPFALGLIALAVLAIASLKS
jgi:hypothetical protein